jgi:hypothetical protein
MADTGTTEDRLAIAHVIGQVARAFDEKMHDALLPKCFEEQARILYRLRGRLIDFSMPGGLARFKFYHDRCFWTQHLVSPHIVEMAGDRARASTPVHAVHVQIRDDGSRNHWLIAAVYHDELVRGPQGWRIQSRTVPCPYVEGDFLEAGVRLFPTLPSYE